MRKDILQMIDANNDGITSEQEIATAKEITELKEKIKKSEAQEKMAWVALFGILLFTGLLFMPFISIERVVAIGEFIGMCYISLAGILAAYMGAQAWTLRKQ